MSSVNETTSALRIRVGLFTLLGLLLIGVMTVFVNDRPFWWRRCQLVHINIPDATGLKTKSPIRSRGLQIGYLKTVELTEEHVRLGICITAPVEILPTTRAFIQAEGFLGDKFVELRPVRYTGPVPSEEQEGDNKTSLLDRVLRELGPTQAWAADAAQAKPSDPPEQDPAPTSTATRRKGDAEIPVGERSNDVQQVVEQVNDLVREMKALTNNLNSAINPKELRNTMVQLNHTLENASRTLSPEGGLNTTAQRTLAKLEDAIEQLRDVMTRVNKGEGSVGMLLNDPSYAEELREAIRNINSLLGRVGGVRFNVDLGVLQIPAYQGARGWFQLRIYPKPDHYYMLGVSVDPRGRRTVINTTTDSGGQSTTVTTTQVEEGGILLTGMLGKIFWNRVEVAGGVLHSDGTASAALRLGPVGAENAFNLRTDVYSRGKGLGLHERISGTFHPLNNNTPWAALYLTGGLESLSQINGASGYFYGAGISFDDENIKLLFALR